MKNYYLITGGCGFIGSNFIEYVLDNDENSYVVNVDKLTYASNIDVTIDMQRKYPGRYEFIKLDIRTKSLLEELFNRYEFTYVVNFAAESHVDNSISNPIPFIDSNIGGTLSLLECIKTHTVKKYVQISTDEVYGSLSLDQNDTLFNECSKICPSSVYSVSKASADMLVLSYYKTFNLPVCITRCSNNYGKYQMPEKLIPLTIYNALHQYPIKIYGDGKNVRDWIYVTNHCEAIYKVLTSGVIGEVYNVGCNNELSNNDIVEEVLKCMEECGVSVDRSTIEYVQDRPGHDLRYGIDSSKIQKELDWTAEMKFHENLLETVRWYVEHNSWLHLQYKRIKG